MAEAWARPVGGEGGYWSGRRQQGDREDGGRSTRQARQESPAPQGREGEEGGGLPPNGSPLPDHIKDRTRQRIQEHGDRSDPATAPPGCSCSAPVDD